MEQVTCERCGSPFMRRMIRHRFCSKDCQQRAAGRRRNRAKLPTPAECSIEGCDKARRTATAAWCEMHYGRWRRNGNPLLLIAPSPSYATDRGYIKLRLPDHPLADGQGYVYEHRSVVYDQVGPGAHPCFWCSKPLTWGRTLHIDHLDHDRGNNNPINLVISCLACNSARKEGDTIERWADLLARRQVLANHADELQEVRDGLLARYAHHSQITATEQPGGWNV